MRGLRRLPVDPRIVEEIQRSPSMSGEQGTGFMQQWGGPQQYRLMASLPPTTRLVYESILSGTSDPSLIEIETGLDIKDINAAISSLKDKGLVHEEEVGV